MIGLPIAIAMGALVGRSEYGLEVIKDHTPDSLEEGKAFIADNRIDIELKEGITEKLYVEVICEADGHQARAIIATSHTNFVLIEHDGETLLDRQTPAAGGTSEQEDITLDLHMVYEFAQHRRQTNCASSSTHATTTSVQHNSPRKTTTATASARPSTARSATESSATASSHTSFQPPLRHATHAWEEP